VTEDPLIDIVIPNRNKVAFLPRTLTSLFAQTETRWRAIAIDGDSTDGSREMLLAAAEKDPRFTVRTAKPASVSGLSLYRSWNHGLMHVRAPYFAVLTSDDLWEPDWLRNALGALRDSPVAVAVAARAVYINADDEIKGPTDACRQFEASFFFDGRERRTLGSKACALRALLLGPIFSTIHSMVFCSEILKDGVLFSEDVGYLADLEYYLHACLRGDVIYDNSFTALFRVYSTQESSKATGPLVSRLWRKVVIRNRALVAQQIGIPEEEIVEATEEILARHSFIMTKPDRMTFRTSKAKALWRMAKASFRSPRLACEYLRCRCSRDRFLTDPATAIAMKLSARHGFN
jgi:glycosyltransferase involved in cell wall biosynthesis